MFIGVSGGIVNFSFPGFSGFYRKISDFESGGRGFESLRARHLGTKLGTQKPAVLALEAATSVRGSTPTELAAGCQKNRQQAGGNEEIQRSVLGQRLSL